ncbi:asparagine synthase (glutamine-hydrolyzing) [Alkalimarinus sediminis]|uniref:asparagine synthase (glutamine-hydrolyzing) n=1 Tax=Alkalimarinus sediminis TaxID=1632866 RepID=A0A9E8KKH5_9ALTE|nr:asparagine synthase (glutamine-hydrolyzing) [Alkalimarinus sediminis]UZW76161.1 asparagine synthase (glutamine-hydrolyzing) [Alkalimarinus sediminis]
MCGIAGIVSPRIGSLQGNLEKMRDAILERGPDGSGIKVYGTCGLVHTRLSIVDIAGGSQPMTTHDNRYTITFNGELYGYKDLKRSLDYPFKTDSDTEVVLALYVKHGASMLKFINGMFAFAIWDNKEKTLFCARDRFGEKPFYYAINQQREFSFSSSSRSLLESGIPTTNINSKAIGHFLQKLYVHPSESIYQDINTLQAGQYLIYTDSKLTVKSYWTMPSTDETVGLSEASEKLTYLLYESVKKQLVADVPLGAFLSGGLDSSTIVASAAKLCPQLTTLTYRMGGGLDEGDYARLVANQYQTNHIEMFDESYHLPDLMLKMAEVYDEPFADSSNIPTYLICKEARKHCKVVLTGDGADELFGGYTGRYRPLVYMNAVNNSSQVSKLAQFIAVKLINKIRPSQQLWQRSLGLQYSLTGKTVTDALDASYNFFSGSELSAFGFNKRTFEYPLALEGNVNDGLKIDASNYMPGDILVKTDKASMAHGLELRSPFLDKELAEFVISLPSNLKIDHERDKILLRNTYEHLWPKKVQGRSKQGFGSPVEKWLKSDEIKSMAHNYLANDKKIHSYVPSGLIDKYKNQSSYQTWALLNLSIWLEQASL